MKFCDDISNYSMDGCLFEENAWLVIICLRWAFIWEGALNSSFLGNGNGFEKSTHKLISTRYYTCKGRQCSI